MPKRRDEGKLPSFARIDQLWTEVHVGDWMRILTDRFPDHKFEHKRGNMVGRCPFHEGDRTPSFIISPSKHIAKCFGGSCGRVFTNPVRFMSAVMGSSYGETLLYMRKNLGLRAIIPEALVARYQEYHVHQERKGRLAKVLRDALMAAWADAQDPQHLYAQQLCGWLRTRGIEHPEVHDIGVFPPALIIDRGMGGADEPDALWAREYLKSVQQGASNVGSLVFIMHDEPDSVSRFKLRKPDSKDIAWIEDAYDLENDSFRGLFGIGFYREFLGNRERPMARTVYLVEGEFDALTPMDQQVGMGDVDLIILALGGKGAQVGGRCAALLQALGIDEARILADNDAGGVGFVQTLLGQVNTEKLGMRILNWPDTGGAKDPDEWIRADGYATFSRYVRAQEHYLGPQEWALERAQSDLARVPADDVRQRFRILTDWGKYLRNPAECRAFCRDAARATDVDEQLLFREIRARDEDEEGFIRRLADAMRDEFQLVGTEGMEGRRRVVEMWHRESRVTVSAIVNDPKSVETALAGVYGTLVDFVRTRVGEPTFLAAEDGEQRIRYGMLNERYREYCNLAMLQLSRGLPDLRAAQRLGQGLHYAGPCDDGHLLHLVNGGDAYRITYPAGQMRVEPLAGPADPRGVLMRLDPADVWLRSVKSARDVEVTEANPRELYDQVREMVAEGWEFKHHELDATFVASYIMCLAVMAIFPRQTAVMFCAEASSGKSRLTSGLIGGELWRQINIVAAARAYSQYSAASIRQNMDSTAMALCLEEFEDHGDHSAKSLRTRAVLELLRDMVGAGALKATVGTTSGHAKTFHLRFPVICCAIRPLREEASLSRFVTIELARRIGRADPVDVLMRKFGEAGIARIRHELATGLLRHVPAIVSCLRTVEREYADGGDLPKQVSSRYREGLFPVLAMQKFLGLPYREFARSFCDSRRAQLAAVSATSENQQVLDAVLSTPFYVATDDGAPRKVTVRALLASGTKEGLDDINRAKAGVYYDHHHRWLVVLWVEALAGVLAGSKFARDQQANYLRALAERAPEAVDAMELARDGVLERIRTWTGPGVRPQHVTGFSVGKLIDEAHGSGAQGAGGSGGSEQRKPRVSTVPALGGSDPDKPKGGEDMQV